MKWILALVLIVAAAATPARAFPVARCVNLGNALEAPRFEGEWGYRIENAHLDAIARAGFDTVRLPVRFSARWDGRRIDPAFLARVDQVIRAALARGLNVILDLHHYEALMADPAAQADSFAAIWAALAAHYAGWPEGLIFELVNEPSGRLTSRRAEALYDRVIPEIRKTNPGRWIVISGGDFASPREMRRIGRADARVVRSFHYYAPWDYTHQGAAWADPPPPPRGWGSAADRRRLRAEIARAARIPGPVFLGEFGTIAGVPGRWDWTAEVRRAAEAAGLGWCVWDFAGSFPLYDTRRRAWLPGALEALMR